MRANVEHNHVLHEHVIILSIDTVPVPRVPESERTRKSMRSVMPRTGSSIVTANFGYMEPPNVPDVLRLLDPARLKAGSTSTALPTSCPKPRIDAWAGTDMAQWRKQLFIATSHLTADAADYFGLPRDRTVIMGSRIEL